MKLEIAKPEQSAELAAFFKKFPLRGPVEIAVDRSKDFFKPYKIQSETSVTYTLRSELKEDLLGVATFAVQDTLLGGKPTRVAFGRDLRILETRQAVLGWSQHFLPVMREVQQVLGAEAFISIMNLNEVKAMNAFVRPRPGKRPLPRYYQYRRFNIVSLHGRFPWAPKPLSTVRIRRGAAHLENALADYIVRKTLQRDLGLCLAPDDFREMLARWDGLKLDDFLVALDTNDNIVGCCAPWNPGGVEEYIPLKYNLLGHNFRQFLKFGRSLGWTRTLTKPSYRLRHEAALDFKYLTFLFADNPDIFESLASDAFDEARDSEFIVYTQMRSDIHLRRPITWISAKLPHGMYVLGAPDAEPPPFIHPANDRPAMIEPFFV